MVSVDAQEREMILSYPSVAKIILQFLLTSSFFRLGEFRRKNIIEILPIFISYFYSPESITYIYLKKNRNDFSSFLPMQGDLCFFPICDLTRSFSVVDQ